MNKRQNGEINLADVKNNQENFKSYLGEIKKETKNIDQKSKKTLCTNHTIKCYDFYYLMMSKTKTKATEGTRLKILTPKQMLQRLPVALAQAKTGNNSESLLNEIRQIVYYLYQSKQITNKVYNNIIKSLQ